MVKSGVEGNDIVLLKLEKKIVFSDFARPICLPETDDWTNSVDSECYSLGWDNKVGGLFPLSSYQHNHTIILYKLPYMG